MKSLCVGLPNDHTTSQEMQVFCKTCSVVLCFDCMLSPSHEGHKFGNVAKEADAMKVGTWWPCVSVGLSFWRGVSLT
jgi:hypothetical protein